MKQCSKCKERKSENEFPKNTASKDGLFSLCKSCVSIRNQKYQQENKTHLNLMKIIYNKINPDKKKDQNKRYRAAHPEQVYEYTHNYYARKKTNCGKITTEQWEVVKQRYGYKCLRCGLREPEIKLTADHVIPLKLGGEHRIENIQPLCKSCNSKKRDKYIDYR